MIGMQLTWGNEEGNYLEPVIEKGTLALGDTLRQNQALLLLLHKGELKERPSVGVGTCYWIMTPSIGAHPSRNSWRWTVRGLVA